MKVLVAFALLAVFGSFHTPCAAAPAVESTTQTEQDDVKNEAALAEVLENVRRRLPSEDVILPAEVKAVIEEALNKQVKDLSEQVEDEELEALMDSLAEYGWLKKKWKQIKKGAKKVAKQVATSVVVSKVAGAIAG
ncbi:uncharacterized protein LOC135367127 isoform X2 [Ornithodoros turicata]|uniref:uncharacterized protein LOC135367127 isoform X2 n=1 Tax=Ornithodoros turicata TaxID=34597 RepID=UPI00313A1029